MGYVGAGSPASPKSFSSKGLGQLKTGDGFGLSSK